MSSSRSDSAATQILLFLAAATVVVLLVVTVAVSSAPPVGAAPLTTFESCDALVDHFRAGNSMEVNDVDAATSDVARAESLAAPGSEAAAAADSAGAGSGSGGVGSTNVAVAGVDEFDVVDAVGDLVVSVDEMGTVRVTHLADRRVVAQTRVAGWNSRLSFDGSVLWVLSQTSTAGLDATTLSSFSVADSGDLTETGSWIAPGSLVDARRIGGDVHVVAVDWADGTSRLPFAPRDTDDANQVGGTDVEEQPWPAFPDGSGNAVVTDEVSCTDVLFPTDTRPASSAVMVSTFTTGSTGVERSAVVELVGGSDFVHSTTEALYVATASPDAASTAIHRFALDGLSYTGSGTVPGRLLNTFSMSDHDGFLRVAVTVDDWRVGRPVADDVVVSVDELEPAPGPGPVPVELDGGVGDGAPPPAVDGESGPVSGDGVDNMIVVLDTAGDLDEVGRVEGLGDFGERIEGVRFSGPVAYVVTFLQIDPLYVIDLSDPTAPREQGSVKIEGFSSYLHPVAGVVVGVGPGGRGFGDAVTVFDVSDPMAPRVSDKADLGGSTQAAWDHHAFGVLEAATFAVPVARWGSGPGGVFDEDLESVDLGVVEGAAAARPFHDVLESSVAVEVFSVVDGRIVSVASIDVIGAAAGSYEPVRTLAYDGSVVVVSAAGVQFSGLGSAGTLVPFS